MGGYLQHLCHNTVFEFSLFGDLLDNSTYLGLEFRDNPSSKIWVLVDSSPILPEPTQYSARAILSLSWKQHLMSMSGARKVEVLSEYFYMKMWALSEVLQAYVTPLSRIHNTHYFRSRQFLGLSRGGPHDESKIRYLYNEYRASPRALAIYAS